MYGAEKNVRNLAKLQCAWSRKHVKQSAWPCSGPASASQLWPQLDVVVNFTQAVDVTDGLDVNAVLSNVSLVLACLLCNSSYIWERLP